MPSVSRARPLSVVLWIVLLAGSAASSEASSPPTLSLGGKPVVRSLAQPAATVRVGFAVRAPLKGRRTLLTLPAGRLSLSVDRVGRLELRRAGRSLARGLAMPRRGWATVRLTARAGEGRAELAVGGRRMSVRVEGLRAERQVILGSRGARILIRSLTVRSTPIAAPGGVVPSSDGAPSGRGPAAPGSSVGSRPAPGDRTRLFGPDSFWNRRLDPSVPIDARSDVYVSELVRQVKAHDPWINTTAYSTPVYTVPADQPTVRVALDTSFWRLQKAWEAVPIPPGARAAAGTDQHLVIRQPATDTMWEFWKAHEVDGVWHARWGGKMSDVSQNPGYFDGPDSSWGATATSLPLLGGLMTVDEVQRGRIDHALAFAIPYTRASAFSWPAQRTDGNVYSVDAIPEGARFRLDPTLDLDTLDLPPLIRMMAEAAQRYGMVLRDKAGVVVFYGEDSTPTGRDPWRGPTGLLSGQYPNRLIEQFPWSRLQALETEMRCCWTL